MRVALDTTFARRGPSGTATYLERIAPALSGLGVEVVDVAFAGRRPPAGGGWRSVRNLGDDLRWVERGLPRRARAAGADVIHHPLPAVAQRALPAQVVTVHDLAFERLPADFDPRFARAARLLHRRAARRADAVICVSRATAADLRTWWGVADERVVVAHHGPGQALPTVAGAAREDFLYVGDDEPRKGLGTLLEAYRRYRAAAGTARDLVLAGAIEGVAEAGVRVVGRPDAATLAGLYARAVALVHPARHEGFGLTPLEAMVAGVPVLAARSPGVHEVCAGAALYVEPGDAAGLADGLARLAEDGALRRELAGRGRARAAEFSWERSARAHVRAYELALRVRRAR